VCTSRALKPDAHFKTSQRSMKPGGMSGTLTASSEASCTSEHVIASYLCSFHSLLLAYIHSLLQDVVRLIRRPCALLEESGCSEERRRKQLVEAIRTVQVDHQRSFGGVWLLGLSEFKSSADSRVLLCRCCILVRWCFCCQSPVERKRRSATMIFEHLEICLPRLGESKATVLAYVQRTSLRSELNFNAPAVLLEIKVNMTL
jgi:hypothetical protein